MRYGETGINLEVDLSHGSIEKEESDPRLTELYLGGLGINAKTIWDRVPPEVEPFSPDNLLIFSAGLLTGTLIPATNRTIMGTISPVTHLFAFSMAGGFWAPELKYAGYDRVIISGKSPEWVYLYIKDDHVEIRDASHLLGKGNVEVSHILREELNEPRLQVASIGIGGEHRSFLATIDFEKSAAGRGGLGAIMGDKKLKAIAVRGTKDVKLANPAGLLELSSEALANIKKNIELNTPEEQRGVLNWSSYGAPDYVKKDDETLHFAIGAWGNARLRRKDFWNKEVEKEWSEIMKVARERCVSCYNCGLGCTGLISMPGRQKYFMKCGKHTYVLASYIEDLNFALDMLAVNNEYGLDVVSTPQTIAFAVELLDAGILTEKDVEGMPSDTEGKFRWLLDRIALREGIGDILSDGTYWAAKRIGKGAEAYAHNNIKKLEQIPFQLPMWDYHWFLMEVTGEKLNNTQLQGLWPRAPLATREQREAFIKDWAGLPDEKFKEYYLNWEPRTHPTIEAACDAVDWMERMHYIDDSTGMCAGFSSRQQKTPFNIHNLPKAISYATGYDIDEPKLWEIAKRTRTLVRAINVTRGVSRKDEVLPEGHYKHRDPETEQKLLDAYYELKGWNNDGVPKEETLNSLGLEDVTEELKQRAII